MSSLIPCQTQRIHQQKAHLKPREHTPIPTPHPQARLGSAEPCEPGALGSGEGQTTRSSPSQCLGFPLCFDFLKPHGGCTSLAPAVPSGPTATLQYPDRAGSLFPEGPGGDASGIRAAPPAPGEESPADSP